MRESDTGELSQELSKAKSIHIGGAINLTIWFRKKTILSILPSHFTKHSTSVVLF